MNSGFAGSASHDDRRRRRLLTEQHENGAEDSTMVLSRAVLESSRNHRYPVKRILPYRAWRLCLLSFVMAALLSGLLYGSWKEQQQTLGPGFSLLFNQVNGRLFTAGAAVVLLMCGHLSGLISWARSRSPNDFSGRYRVWKPIGLFFYFASLGIVIRADEVLNASFAYAAVSLPWSVPAWNWMIPTGGLSALIVWVIHREMSISNLSRVQAWLGYACLVTGLGLPFVPDKQLPVRSTPLVEQGLILGGLMLIGLSLMWFAHHVLYISSDPAARKPSLILKMLKALFRKRAGKPKANRKQSKKSSPATSAAEADEASSDTENKKSRKTSSRKRGRKKKTSTAAKSSTQTATAPQKPAAPEPAKPEAQVEKPTLKLRAEDISTGQMDEDILEERLEMMELLAEEGEALDQDLLKGLTKKQKKQMRSAWRDLERQYAQRRAG